MWLDLMYFCMAKVNCMWFNFIEPCEKVNWCVIINRLPIWFNIRFHTCSFVGRMYIYMTFQKRQSLKESSKTVNAKKNKWKNGCDDRLIKLHMNLNIHIIWCNLLLKVLNTWQLDNFHFFVFYLLQWPYARRENCSLAVGLVVFIFALIIAHLMYRFTPFKRH